LYLRVAISHFFVALGYMKKGVYRQALAEAEENVRAGERAAADLSVLASTYALAGECDKAMAVLR
jgi:Tfp pilus assembly protein PilF